MRTYLDTAPHFVEGTLQSSTGEGACVLQHRAGEKGEVPFLTIGEEGEQAVPMDGQLRSKKKRESVNASMNAARRW